ncbi:unnamed protein product, partial [Closterium sp. Yama58-4]
MRRPCDGVECGLDASCRAVSDIVTVCDCTKQGYFFNEANKTCFAPGVRTTVALQASGNSAVGQRNATFFTRLPAEQATGATACNNLYAILSGSTNITVVWNTTEAVPGSLPLGNAMCRNVSFYGGWDCMEKLNFTITRPAKKGSAYPVTKRTVQGVTSLRSVGCEITTCHKDCGAAACVLYNGNPRCQCPAGRVFNAAKKRCR